jgi:hypothetical protein
MLRRHDAYVEPAMTPRFPSPADPELLAMSDAIPPRFDVEFLEWLRQQTERAWTRYPTGSFERYKTAGIGGASWVAGTRWLPGLSDAAIDGIEQQWSIRFPPDYRLFLRHLHSVDRRLSGARYIDATKMIPMQTPSFYDWLTDVDALRDAFGSLLDGLLVDVEHADVWPPSWGERPDTREARAVLVHEQMRAAPRLIPVFGHRYLLAEPCQAGNPVLSIRQTDGIVYGANLRQYLLIELANVLGIDPPSRDDVSAELRAPLESIPFWGEVFDASR